MIEGLLIKESFEDTYWLNQLNIDREEVLNVDNPATNQPRVWNIVYFRESENKASEIALMISEKLKDGAWFVDFRTTDEVYIIFRGVVHIYKRGDRDAREKIEKIAMDIYGIPRKQLKWED